MISGETSSYTFVSSKIRRMTDLARQIDGVASGLCRWMEQNLQCLFSHCPYPVQTDLLYSSLSMSKLRITWVVPQSWRLLMHRGFHVNTDFPARLAFSHAKTLSLSFNISPAILTCFQVGTRGALGQCRPFGFTYGSALENL